MQISEKKIYAVINILGLALSFALIFCIYGYIQHETTYDAGVDRDNNTYRVLMKKGEDCTIQIPLSLSAALISSFSDDVRSFTNVVVGTQTFSYNDVAVEIPILLSDSSFFKNFDFDFIQGTPDNCLEGKNKLVITESVSKRYFKNENPIGKTVTDNSGIKPETFEITAVIQDVPTNSHLKFEGISSALNNDPALPLAWDLFATRPQYISLAAGATIDDLRKKMPLFYKRYEFPSDVKIEFEQLGSIHLETKAADDQFIVGEVNNIYLFWVTIVLLIFVTVVNHFNLFGISTLSKARAFGVRKVLGADNRKIMILICRDSLRSYTIAVPLAILLSLVVWPVFTAFLLKEPLPFSFLFTPRNLILLVCIAGAAGTTTALLVSTSVLSRTAKELIRNQQVKLSVNKFLKSILMIVQFTFTSLLVICSIAFMLQLTMLYNLDLGFKKDNLLILKSQRYDKAESFIHKLENHKDIERVAISNFDLGNFYSWVVDLKSDDDQHSANGSNRIAIIDGDIDFGQTLGIQMKEGRFFSEEHGIDKVDNDSIAEIAKNGVLMDKSNLPIIISEQARRFLKDPTETAVGQIFAIENDVFGKVIGVSSDLKGLSLKDESLPMVMRVKNKHNYYGYLYIRLNGDNKREAVNFIEQQWKQAFPGVPFTYSEAEERLNTLYDEDRRISQLLTLMGMVTITISCIGLFGLLSFDIKNRFREIGIRKTLGAPDFGIMTLMSQSYFALIGIGLIVSIPTAGIVINKWLESYAYRINTKLLILPSLVSILIVLFFVSLVIFIQVKRALNMKPTLSLKVQN